MGISVAPIRREPRSTQAERGDLSFKPARGGAFTLIELMVVVAIIVMAAGLMTPTITDFFKNRQLEGIRGHFGSAFNMARLDAVNQGKPVSLVFFREGVRVYDDTRRTFDLKDPFNPDTSPFASDKVWYVLGFANKKPSLSLPSYKKWEKAQLESQDLIAVSAKDSSTSRRRGRPTGPVFNVNGLPKLTFLRDGSVVFGAGSDVSTTEYNSKQVPDNADIMFFQAGNTTACFMDIRPMGQIRSKIEPMAQAATKPTVESGDSSGESFELDYETPKPKSDSEKEGEGE